jgi:Ca-activated chloride channel family protein
MAPAMQHALSQGGATGRLRQVVFLTDGDIGNEQALFDIITQNLADSRLFPVGIGSAPNSYFMTRAARFGRGSYTFIGDLSEVRERMSGLFGRLAAPVLTDVRLSWRDQEQQPAQACDDQSSQHTADLYAGEPLLLLRCFEQAPASVSIEGELGQRPWRRDVQLRGGASAPGIHVAWARAEIAEWMAQKTLGEAPEQVRENIVRLGLEHHLVSDYTSLVAVDKTPVRPLEDALHSKPVPTHLPKGWSSARVFGNLPQTATPARLQLLLGMLLMLSALLLYRRGRA